MRTIYKLVVVFGLLVFSRMLLAGAPTQSAAQAMTGLQPLVGCWQGQGWIQRGPKERHTFSSHECVRKVLGGNALMIEGEHRATNEQNANRIVHQAIAIMHYLPEESRYQFHAWLVNGREGDYRGELTAPGVFVWHMPAQGRVPEIRYTMRFDETSWKETGEMQAPDGQWRPFFQMHLTRQ